jgi:hypothetical protein
VEITNDDLTKKLLLLARHVVLVGFYRPGEYGNILDVFSTGGDYGESILIRPQKDGAYHLEKYSFFRHSSADIPIWENGEWDEMPEPWVEETKIASVPVRSFENPTSHEVKEIEEKIIKPMSRYAKGELVETLEFYEPLLKRLL